MGYGPSIQLDLVGDEAEVCRYRMHWTVLMKAIYLLWDEVVAAARYPRIHHGGRTLANHNFTTLDYVKLFTSVVTHHTI
jgi:hypothetical protein